ncbi:MAG: FecR domain-containing protein [Polyangiaceae bacterium]
MSAPPREPGLSPKLAMLSELGQTSVLPATRSELERGLGRLNAKLAAGRVRRRHTARWTLAGLGVAATALVFLQLRSLSRAHSVAALPPLSYEIDGGRVLDGGYLREVNHVGMALRFNEGTRLDFAPGARGRLRSVGRQDARIAVDSGFASLRITPNPARHWSIEAGPFVVTVKGTVFDVSWQPSLERFELGLHEGKVTVEGPVTGGQLTLERGQHLVVDLAKAETVITEESAARRSGDTARTLDDAIASSSLAISSATPTQTNSETLPSTSTRSPYATAASNSSAQRSVAPSRTAIDPTFPEKITRKARRRTAGRKSSPKAIGITS